MSCNLEQAVPLPGRLEREVPMLTASAAAVLQVGSGNFLTLALAFFVLAIIAGIAGFRQIAGLTMEIARLLVLIFIVLAIVALLL